MADTGIRVNFSEEEAGSEARLFLPLPTGQYNVKVTEVELTEVTQGKNEGKPYWKLVLTVQDGEYIDRKLWTNAMLFEGALYTTAQLLKATGFGDSIKKGVIPDGDKLIGKDAVAVVARVRDKYQEEKLGTGEAVFKNDVKGFKAPGAVSSSGGTGKSSLLP